ncbi:YafY family transcriptional regulator [Mesorhizobium sp. CA14]|uniref:helix-turn-helix transcriptional regulator n=1 Tax=Mesorhizobium sp. CA14 TaxID=2876642 RepID=UPI001CCF8241|nr:YafY family protein [Mesorhizobium sp. CA14]MBZ9851790.1 YafY family transcriptional regulator [Mesorhizobium sp. CA14]
MRRADRLFQIIQILRRTDRAVTAAAIAEELEVSKRTVYRDIADLIGQRVPIQGEAGFGFVLDRSYDMPPLMLTADEIEAVVLGAQWVSAHSDHLLANAARDLLVKITAAIPEDLRPFVAEASVTARPPLAPAPEDALAVKLRQSVREGRKLRLVYRDLSGQTTERVVWPVTLGYAETSRLLIAWCELRQGFRHFRCERIRSADIMKEPIGLRSGELRRRWQSWRADQLRYLQLDRPSKLGDDIPSRHSDAQ